MSSKIPFLYDIHVHEKIPFSGSLFARWFHGLKLNHDPGFFVVSFYGTPIPTIRSGYRRMVWAIENFVRHHLEEIHTGRGKAPRRFAISLESARLIPGPEDIARLYQLGVRVIQPMHFLDSRYGHSCREGLWPPSKKGLTPKGVELMREMDRNKMILDLAHMNRATMEDSLKEYAGPVICSHTGLFSHRSTERNIHDEIAQEIFHRGGLVGLTPWRALHSKPHLTAKQWLRRYAETLQTLLRLGGEKGLCIGTDRGAPLWIPKWFFRKKGLDEIRQSLLETGVSVSFWNRFLYQNASDFLSKTIGPSGLPIPSGSVKS